MLLVLWTSCTIETIWTLCSKTSRVAQLFQGLESRLQQIESQISNQNTRWKQIEEVLQNQNRTLQNQTLRISSIENQMTEMNKFKCNIARVETYVQLLNSDVKNSNKHLKDYQKKSIETFSELCDEITKDKQSSDYIIGNLLERVGSLESDHSKLENTVVDLQCCSMRDNLIFTGIDEVDLGGRRTWICRKQH